MSFVMRKLDRMPQTLGEKLRALRRGQAVSLVMLEETTHIQRRYLEALEHGYYDELPEPLYTRNFIRAYARALEADEKYFIELYEEESGRMDLLSPHRLPRERVRKARFFVLPRVMTMSLISLVVLGVIGYLGWQIQGLLEPPRVVLDSPFDGMYADSAMLNVRGMVLEDDVTLRVNGEEVVISDENNFVTTVDLSRGLNVITIEAERRYSRTAVIYRRVVFDSAEPTPISLNR
ncbi:MAG: helix-turn-helix domain-containing protein [Candidatus Uhrbacteria bacterium]|nr:helix-turn-helix domain-containing protein [Candidatus Uhrbacteria bacterium]